MTTTACKSNYQALQEAYYQTDYIKAGNIAIDAHTKNAHTKELSKFYTHYGTSYLEKSLNKALDLSKQLESNENILYLQKLIIIFENMILLEFPIQNLETALTKATLLLENALTVFINHHATQAKRAFDQKLFRKSVTHLEKIKEVAPQNTAVKSLIKDILKKALHTLQIQPFQTKVSPIIKGRNIEKIFSRTLLETLNNQSSPFLTCITTSQTPLTPSNDYILKGTLDAQEISTEILPERIIKTDILRYRINENGIPRWYSEPFEYEVLKAQYKIKLAINCQVIQKKTNKTLQQFKFEKSLSREQLYKGHYQSFTPPSDIEHIQYPLAYQKLIQTPHPIEYDILIRDTIDLTAKTLSALILDIIDK